MTTKDHHSLKFRLQNKVFTITFLLLVGAMLNAQSKNFDVKSFDKVKVSPHIQINFIKGEKESVTVNDIKVDRSKLNIEVSGKTLHIYLDGAKTVTKNEKVNHDNYKGKKAIYQGTIVKATVTYKSLNELSLRGDEKFVCESPLNTDKFELSIYGEADVTLNEVKFNNLHTAIYGESFLKIKNGTIGRHKIVAYGESEIYTLDTASDDVKITAYGESDIQVNVKDNLKLTAYGEATIKYKGSPTVDKGIVIGDASISKIH